MATRFATGASRGIGHAGHHRAAHHRRRIDPLYVGDLDPGARLLEDSSGLTRALAGQIGGPFFYRYGRPGEL